MAKKTEKVEAEAPARAEGAGVVARNITTEMRESFLDYAMSVITDRALPDVNPALQDIRRERSHSGQHR